MRVCLVDTGADGLEDTGAKRFDVYRRLVFGCVKLVHIVLMIQTLISCTWCTVS
jgi:hypothetical protein